MMTPDAIRELTLALMERDRETFMSELPALMPLLAVNEYPGFAELIAGVFAAGFAYGAAAGLEVSREISRDAATEFQRAQKGLTA